MNSISGYQQSLLALRRFALALERRAKGKAHPLLIDDIECSINALEESFEELMMSTSGPDDHCLTDEPRHFQLNSLLSRIYDDFKSVAEQRKLDFSVQLNGHMVHAEKSRLEMLVARLTALAIQRTDQGSVSITTVARHGCISIAVTDSATVSVSADADNSPDNPNSNSCDGLAAGFQLSTGEEWTDLPDVSVHVESHRLDGNTSYINVLEGNFAKCLGSAESLHQAQDILGPQFVLLVDNDRQASNSTERLLVSWGYTVMCATSGDAAIMQLREIDETPDLILCHYHLLDSESGVDAVQRLRSELGFNLPAIILTDQSATPEPERMKALGLPTLDSKAGPSALRQLIALEILADRPFEHRV